MNKEKKIIFFYNGETIYIQCKIDENIFKRFSKETNKGINNICFLYNGDIIKEDFDLKIVKEDDIKILIIDFEFERKEKESLKQSKEIICPICKELCEINFNNYKISLNNCINKHCFPDLIINEFNDFQKIINEKEILCGQCQSNKFQAYNNQFFRCCNCNINLCPICKNTHDKKHIIINYEDKNILCNQHGERYILYCKNNNRNMCDLCDMKNKNYIFLYKFFKNIYKINNINELQIKITKLKNELKNLPDNNELNLVIDNLDKLINIGNNIMNYNMKYKNYYSLLNMKNINDYIVNVNKDLENIINEKKEVNRLKYIKEIYDKMIINNIITIKYEIPDLSFTCIKEITEINIFGKIFVEKNKDKFQIIINGKIHELTNYLNIKELEIKDDILEIKLKQIKNTNDISYMFYNCINLISISDISNWKTDNIENMAGLFSNCKFLKKLPDISKWNTINVKRMNNMFSGCYSLRSLPDISNWNTENVIDISNIFCECGLNSLPDISKWNTKNIIDMSGIFSGYKLKNTDKSGNLYSPGRLAKNTLNYLPDISKWNTKKVTNLKFIFSGCYSLKSLPDISKWNIENVTDISSIFGGCKSLKSLPDISKWNIENVKDISDMFSYSGLNSLPDISKWNKKNITKKSGIFSGCKSLKSLPEI